MKSDSSTGRINLGVSKGIIYVILTTSYVLEVDVDIPWVKWKTIVLDLFDRHAPAKVHRVKDYCNPWITKDIMCLMCQRDYVHSKAVKPNSNDPMKEYRILRNNVTSEIGKAQTNYHKHKIEENNGNNKFVYVAHN